MDDVIFYYFYIGSPPIVVFSLENIFTLDRFKSCKLYRVYISKGTFLYGYTESTEIIE